MSKRLRKLLKNKNFFSNVPNLKFYEINFFLDKMEEKLSEVDIFKLKKGVKQKKVTDKDIHEAGVILSYYVSAFYSAVFGFLDSLAILHTKNRKKVYNKVNFTRWLYELLDKNPKDSYLNYLKAQDKNWISDFRKNRNMFVHHSHVFLSIPTLMHLEAGRGKEAKIEFFKLELKEGEKELIPYCRHIRERCEKIASESNNNRNKEYYYNP